MDGTRTRTESKYPERDSYTKNMGIFSHKFKNLAYFLLFPDRFDDIRALEIKEIQEEEFYINNLKKQREKVTF